MALQPVTQGFEPPPQIGELLTVIAPPTTLPRQITVEDISAIEDYLQPVESAAESLGILVEYARQAGLDDDVARRFDEWTENYGPVGAFDAFVKLGLPRLNKHSDRICKIVEGWQHKANAGLIEPHPPPELVKRVMQLDTRVKELTEHITKREDNELVARMLIRVARHRPLTNSEALRMYDAARVAVPAPGYPSVHRSDWYDDDGRLGSLWIPAFCCDSAIPNWITTSLARPNCGGCCVQALNCGSATR